MKFDECLAADGILLDDLVLFDSLNLFDDCLFCIHLQRQYAACTELSEFLENFDAKTLDPEDKHTTKYLNALRVSVYLRLSIPS